MISGEYLVLAGATALAIPVRYGQGLRVKSRKAGSGPKVSWTSRVCGKKFLQIAFLGQELEISRLQFYGQYKQAEPEKPARFIRRVLMAAREVNPLFLSEEKSWEVEAEVEFDLEWGLGSSSSLISNIAYWSDVNPFILAFMVSKGSGYDIACARSRNAILYTFIGQGKQPLVKETAFSPPFSDRLYFVYSGRKQNTDEEIKHFRPGTIPGKSISEISEISRKMAKATNLESFMDLMKRHEYITAEITGGIPAMDSDFRGFKGAVKQLGAWGGDFLLAASVASREEVLDYFRQCGKGPVFGFNEMMIKNE